MQSRRVLRRNTDGQRHSSAGHLEFLASAMHGPSGLRLRDGNGNLGGARSWVLSAEEQEETA